MSDRTHGTRSDERIVVTRRQEKAIPSSPPHVGTQIHHREASDTSAMLREAFPSTSVSYGVPPGSAMSPVSTRGGDAATTSRIGA
jgi:hypothetical protein